MNGYVSMNNFGCRVKQSQIGGDKVFRFEIGKEDKDLKCSMCSLPADCGLYFQCEKKEKLYWMECLACETCAEYAINKNEVAYGTNWYDYTTNMRVEEPLQYDYEEIVDYENDEDFESDEEYEEEDYDSDEYTDDY